MSMDLGGAKGGVKADINVTPLVDVMLVLLIIMMLVAPMLQQGVQVRLPKATNTNDKPESAEQTVLAIAANRALYLNARPVQESELATKVNEILESKSEKIVIIQRRRGSRVRRGDGGDGPAAHRPASKTSA